MSVAFDCVQTAQRVKLVMSGPVAAALQGALCRARPSGKIKLTVDGIKFVVEVVAHAETRSSEPDKPASEI